MTEGPFRARFSVELESFGKPGDEEKLRARLERKVQLWMHDDSVCIEVTSSTRVPSRWQPFQCAVCGLVCVSDGVRHIGPDGRTHVHVRDIPPNTLEPTRPDPSLTEKTNG